MRRQLEDGLALARLTKTQLGARARLSRTTVQQAFNTNAPVPTAETIAALARALDLSDVELLRLRRTAAGETSVAQEIADVLGKSIRDWNAHDLEVHPAGPGTDRHQVPVLSSYIPRAHDRMLEDTVSAAMDGHSTMLVLVGESSTGKTRACWEAVQPLAAKEWRLWHPFDPTRVEAAHDALAQVGPKTVVWLNEAQHYLGDPALGEQIAAAIHALLTTPARGPVLVLGTLWPEYERQYTSLPAAGQRDDAHSRVRELLAGRTISVPECFNAEELATAAQLAGAGDQLLADALTRVDSHGRVTQDLAGAPQLLRCYESGSPAARALLQAAMDARRLGFGLHLPQSFLVDATNDYLNDVDHGNLAEDWVESAFAELTKQVHGKQAPLRRVMSRLSGALLREEGPGSDLEPVFRLADYLEQYGRKARRRTCPPASFWQSAHTNLTNPAELKRVAYEAHQRYRIQWEHRLMRRAIRLGDPTDHQSLVVWLDGAGRHEEAESVLRQAAETGAPQALTDLAIRLMNAGDHQEGEQLLQQAFDAGNVNVFSMLAERRREAGDQDGAESLVRRAVDAGHPSAWRTLAEWCRAAGDHEGSEALVQKFADAGKPQALVLLAEWRRAAGDFEGAESAAQQAADAGDIEGIRILAEWREEVGDRATAEALAQRAADAGDPRALLMLARRYEEAGHPEEAEKLARQAAALDSTYLEELSIRRERAGDCERAENLARQAADAGNWNALTLLAVRREKAGDHEGAETLAREASAGNPNALTWLGFEALQWRIERGQKRAESLFQQGADAGDPSAMNVLGGWREEAGDSKGAEELAWQAADAGTPDAVARLVSIRKSAGNAPGAYALAGQVADAGHAHLISSQLLKAWWPYGIDPDGTPAAPWQ